MSEFYLEYRGLINSLMVLAFACYIPFRAISAIRKQGARSSPHPIEATVPQHPLITALNELGAIGVGVVWTAVFYMGPSLMQLWHGEGKVSHWLSAFLYTNFWLSFSRVVVPEKSASVVTAIIIRVAVYGIFFFAAIVIFNDW
jgi:hypothetical protein